LTLLKRVKRILLLKFFPCFCLILMIQVGSLSLRKQINENNNLPVLRLWSFAQRYRSHIWCHNRRQAWTRWPSSPGSKLPVGRDHRFRGQRRPPCPQALRYRDQATIKTNLLHLISRNYQELVGFKIQLLYMFRKCLKAEIIYGLLKWISLAKFNICTSLPGT